MRCPVYTMPIKLIQIWSEDTYVYEALRHKPTCNLPFGDYVGEDFVTSGSELIAAGAEADPPLQHDKDYYFVNHGDHAEIVEIMDCECCEPLAQKCDGTSELTF